MEVLINEIKVYYEEYGSGIPILFLHGWGNDLNSFYKQIEYFKDKYHLFLLDLPGFGKTEEPNIAYNLNNYVDIVHEFVQKIINNKELIIITHSFGSRIAIKLTSFFHVKGLIIISGAGIKHLKMKKKIKILYYKIKKQYYKLTKNYLDYNLLIKNSGSSDYISLSSTMKETMNLVIKEDLRKCLNKIKVKTLLIYGDSDTETPYIDGIIMNKKIKDSYLYKIENGNHFIHIENSSIVNDIIERFISDIND